MRAGRQLRRSDGIRGSTDPVAFPRSAGPIGTVHLPEVRAGAPGFLARARPALGEAGHTVARVQGPRPKP